MKRFGDERVEMLPKNKGKGAKLLEHTLFRQQALLCITPMDKPGWAFYKFNVGSCLQEQSAEDSNFFPLFFPHLMTSAAAVAATAGMVQGRDPCGQHRLSWCPLPSLPPASNRDHALPAPAQPPKGARGANPKTQGWS